MGLHTQEKGEKGDLVKLCKLMNKLKELYEIYFCEYKGQQDILENQEKS